MLQKEDLKEVIAEVLETMVGKNLLKEPAPAESTEYYTVCTLPILRYGAWRSVAASMSIRLGDATCIPSRKWTH